jgi:hypothetical protein
LVEMRGFVANKVCVIAKRKCLHFKAERQPGYRGSRGDAVLRFFKIARNPRFGIKKEQPSLFLFWWEARDTS